MRKQNIKRGFPALSYGTSTSAHAVVFPFLSQGRGKALLHADSRAQERWGNHRQRALEKQQSEENISHAGNGAEICPTENKSVRFQAGTWAICEQQKEPKAASELLAAEQLVWFE